MKDFLLKYLRDEEVLRQLLNLIKISWSTLGIVYVFGRMLEIARTPLQKNKVAVIFQILNGAGMVYFENHCSHSLIRYAIWSAWLYITIGFTVYVWVFWRSADRLDSFMDMKGFRDKIKYALGRKKKGKKS